MHHSPALNSSVTLAPVGPDTISFSWYMGPILIWLLTPAKPHLLIPLSSPCGPRSCQSPTCLHLQLTVSSAQCFPLPWPLSTHPAFHGFPIKGLLALPSSHQTIASLLCVPRARYDLANGRRSVWVLNGSMMEWPMKEALGSSGTLCRGFHVAHGRSNVILRNFAEDFGQTPPYQQSCYWNFLSVLPECYSVLLESYQPSLRDRAQPPEGGGEGSLDIPIHPISVLGNGQPNSQGERG